jgi:hypothetical protein
MDWTGGYVADIGYTYGYYTELNPLRVKLAFLSAGLAAPEMGAACELGFGQGVSVNMHAAASVTRWSGTDFNPSQAGYAQELAQVSSAGARLFDEGFAEFCQRGDLPDFDYIGLHGIWSWISDENRAILADFLRRKLKVGGVVYVSYNILPGWAPMLPLRHLLTQHADTMTAPGVGITQRIDEALDFADKLFETNPMYARANPIVAERLKGMRAHNRNYLAHEYFNRDWHPMPFADMAALLEPGKLTYACSASLAGHIDAINLGAEQRNFVQDIKDPVFQQTVRDFMTSAQFRKDYWVKGARKLSALEKLMALRELKLVMFVPRVAAKLTFKGVLGEVKLSEAIYNPIYELMADHQVRSLGQIEEVLKARGIELGQLLEAALLLVEMGMFGLAQEADVVAKVKPRTDQLNLHLMNKARTSDDVTFLASPVTGGGIPVSRFDQMFLLARAAGSKSSAQMAHYVWGLLNLQGRKLVKEGVQIESDEANLAELQSQIELFIEQRLPVLRALGIVS